MKFTLQAALWIAVSCSTLLGQTKVSSHTFRVEGTITSAFDSLPGGVDSKGAFIPLPRVEVTFHGADMTKTIKVDDKGFYQAELTFGLYKMTVHGPKLGQVTLTPYVRIFRVKSPGTVVLNGDLYMARTNCDAIVNGDTEEQKKEAWKNICGGEDSFPIPSRDDTPLELYIQYPQRKISHHDYEYKINKIAEPDVPVFVAYNLFSLQAESVQYNVLSHTLTASGNVLTEDGSGTTRHADSIALKIKDAKVIILQ